MAATDWDCVRDECRRRMVQGEFEVGGGSGGSGLPGPGQPGHGGITGPSTKLPSPDSPVSDVNSILAGAHLQVRKAFFFNSKLCVLWNQSDSVSLIFIQTGI